MDDKDLFLELNADAPPIGTRTIDSSGYAYIYLGPIEGTRREHTWVMEQVIGRRLRRGENVHHLNGIRDDNRPENLELWRRPQPSGIRARDALKWAREIIALYEEIEDKI